MGMHNLLLRLLLLLLLCFLRPIKTLDSACIVMTCLPGVYSILRHFRDPELSEMQLRAAVCMKQSRFLMAAYANAHLQANRTLAHEHFVTNVCLQRLSMEPTSLKATKLTDQKQYLQVGHVLLMQGQQCSRWLIAGRRCSICGCPTWTWLP